MNKKTILLLALFNLTGCSDVKSWQRGYLAKSVMQADSNPELNSMAQHAYGSREAGSVYGKSTGAGCGCY